MRFNRHAAFIAFATFKNRLNDYADDKNRQLIDYLISLDYGEGEDFKYPETSTIARSLNVSSNRLYPLIKSLYERLISSLNQKVQVISNVRYDLHITLLFEEDFQRRGLKESYFFVCRLPFVPRVGDKIELPFLDKRIYYNEGCVHDVKHTIDGHTQVIEILVHPFNNHYGNHLQLKKEHEGMERFRRELEIGSRERGSGKQHRNPFRP